MMLSERMPVVRFRRLMMIIQRNAKLAISETLQAILFFGGLAAVAASGWMVYHPLGVFAGGLFAVWVSFLREK